VAESVQNEHVLLKSVCEALNAADPSARTRIAAYIYSFYGPNQQNMMTGEFVSIRIRIAILYLLLGILFLACTTVLGDKVYRAESTGDIHDAWRYLWVLPFVFFGVSARAYQWRMYNDTPWPAYLRYLPLVGAGGFFVFVACHSFLDLDNWLYYPTSAIAVFWLGRVPGSVPGRILGLGK
jgi:hypothetical protein